MRRVLSLLLTAAMVLSLLVVAGADQQTVTLKTAKSVNGNEVTYTFTLDAAGTKGVGALSFDVETTNLTFKAKSDVYNPVLGTTFMPGVPGVQDGSYGFYTATNRFIAYGGDGAKEGTRLLKDSVQLVSLTYIIADTSADYELKVTEFKACYSGAEAMTTNKYNCVIAPVTDGGSSTTGVTVSGTVTSFGGETDTVTVELWKADAASAAYQTTVTGNSAAYTIANVESGSYTMKVKKNNHVTREYAVVVASENVTQDAKICLLGDVTGDGNINSADVGRLYAHVRGTKVLTDTYMLACGDVAGGNNVINTADVGRLYAHIRGTKPLW